MDETGIFLWSNAHAYNAKMLKPVDSDSVPPTLSLLPTVKLEEEESEFTLEEEETKEEIEYQSPSQISECSSVSGLPNSRWVELINLKLIKLRNKVQKRFI